MRHVAIEENWRASGAFNSQNPLGLAFHTGLELCGALFAKCVVANLQACPDGGIGRCVLFFAGAGLPA